jgi:hypothetical protein
VSFDPQSFLTSTTRALTSYLEGRFAAAVQGHGLEAYEIIMEYPEADDLPKGAELEKTVIHFQIDDILPKDLGLGTSFVNAEIVDGTDLVAGSVVENQAMQNTINFDVGVWASDQSGGVTSRLRAYEYLHRFLAGKLARDKLLAATDGSLEILYYRSGRFVTQKISDVRLFCVVGAELEVRVFSRDDADPEILVDQEPTQEPVLKIQGDNGSLVDLED